MTVFAFSDNLSAENSNFSAVSGNQRNQFLECMVAEDEDEVALAEGALGAVDAVVALKGGGFEGCGCSG